METNELDKLINNNELKEIDKKINERKLDYYGFKDDPLKLINKKEEYFNDWTIL